MMEDKEGEEDSILDESTGSSGRPTRSCAGQGISRLGNPVDHTQKAKDKKGKATPTIQIEGGVSFFTPTTDDVQPNSDSTGQTSTEASVTPKGAGENPTKVNPGASLVSSSSSTRRRLQAAVDAKKKLVELNQRERELGKADIQDQRDLANLELELEKAKIDEEEGSDTDRASGTIKGLSEEEEELLSKFEKECQKAPHSQQRKAVEEDDRRIALVLQKKEEIAAQFARSRQQKEAETKRRIALSNEIIDLERELALKRQAFENPIPPTGEKAQPTSPPTTNQEKTADHPSQESDSDDSSSEQSNSDEEEPPPKSNPKEKKKSEGSGKESNPDQFASFADSIAQAMMKVAASGGVNSNNEKFLARQVQGKDLPHFTGKPEEWTVFYSAYTSSTKTCVYSDADNLVRLQKCLKGDALRSVQPLLVKSTNVPKVMKKLEQRFGNPDRIIRSLINNLKDTPPIKEFKVETIVDMGIAVDNLVATITALECPEHLSNPQLLEDLLNKFPTPYQMRWIEWMKKKKLPKSLTSFSKWMEKETASALELLPLKSTTEEKKQGQAQGHGHGRKPQNILAADNAPNNVSKPIKNCRCCSGPGHRHQKCKKLEEMDPFTRFIWVKENKLCYGCLNFGHSMSQCRSKKPCPINGCGREHHPLIHSDPQPRRRDEEPQPAAVTEDWPDRTLRIGQGEGQALLNIIPVSLTGPSGMMKTFAILDPGSAHTLIQKQVAVNLGLNGTNKPFSFCWINNEVVSEPDSQLVELDISGPNKQKYVMTHVRTVEVLKFSSKSVKSSLLRKWKHLRSLDIKTFDDGVPTILIGQPHAYLIVPTRRIAGPPNAPVAAETKLGWVLNGVEPYTLDTEVVQSVNLNQDSDQDLHKLVKRYFTTEEFGVDVQDTNPQTKEDAQAQNYFLSNLKKMDGRFETRLLWRDDSIQLPESKSNALRRLYSVERKMDRDPDYATKYANNINEYINLGYLRKLTEEERKHAGPRTWYLPHFAVSKASKPDKIRLVFDAAARTNGTSLNENLLRGLDQLNPLPAVLFKFRERSVAFTADIKQMFHRVAIEKADQHSQRMLWRGMDRKSAPEEYAMTVMTFGATCSPYFAQAVKNKNAQDHAEEHPDAADAIIRKHYVDDYLDSCDTVEEGLRRFKEVFKIHQAGNFHICNWITNREEMSSLIPEELRSNSQKQVGLEKENLWTDRVLGMMWNPTSDQFRFVTSFHRVPKEVVQGKRIPTKREALSLIMSLFDPLGFAACLTIKAKILLQDTWRSKIDWDTELPDYVEPKWSNLLKEIRRVQEFTIPRLYSTSFSSSQNVQLHIFCDASSSAFAAVAYFRVMTNDGFDTSLVCAKTRVAPLNPLTIPRLELQGAVMGTRLAQSIVQCHDVAIHKIHYWTDSKNVLDWIHSDARKFNQFVSHRIGEIHEKTDVLSWHWISTHQNVADEATRDNKPCDFTSTSRWLSGPSFLKDPEEDWPINLPPLDEIDPKTREEKNNVGVIEEVSPSLNPPVDITRFSNWSRLVRATAIARKFVSCKIKRTSSTTITPEGVKESEKLWWRWSQQESFGNELGQLRNNQQIKKGVLSNLSLILDEEGILRLLGKIPFCPPAANLQIDPVILSSSHPYTKLMLNFLHRKFGHHGQEQVVNEVRQTFFIPGLRAAVRKTWTNCQVCKNSRAQPKPPLMGSLPPARIDCFHRPYTHTGVDYFGPYEVVVKRSREKRYGALFTCLTTRAIHLEIAHSLSTDSFLMALRRFIARRGNPQEIWSDNGTNFVGANNELKACLQELNQEMIINEMTLRSIKWNFIAPLSPHMGGSWERMVKAVKIALSTTMKERHPKDEVLSTLFAEAEMVVNGHPLTYIGMEQDSPEALTPNHFLLGTSSANQPPGKFDDSDLIPGKQWRVAQRLADFFWRRWITEFLPTLTRRTKWNKKEDMAKVGDVVIIADGNLPRNSWPKGIIVKVYEKDGQVRVAEVKTASGTYRRPVHKLCILDVRAPANQDNQPQQQIDTDSV